MMDGMYHSAGIDEVPGQKLTTLEKLFAHVLSHIEVGQLLVRFPSGAERSFVGAPMGLSGHIVGEMHIEKWSALSRALKGGTIGLAEGFMAGEWTSPDLTNLLRVLAANMDRLEARLKRAPLRKLRERLGHWFNRNSKSGSRRNISYHYDLGNDFYALWLDRTMTYSAGLYDFGAAALEEAQTAKYAALADAVGIRPGNHVLEIGCGWGGFAEYAIRELGCRVTGVTLSKEQLAFANARLELEGLADRADLRLCDYRDLEGQFDHIVSIEMLEAVGEDYWPTYFDKVRTLLRPGGRAGIQVITIDDNRFERYRQGVDFIQKYIFPGGMLPSDKVLKKLFRDHGFAVRAQRDFGIGYAQTLKHWHQTFAAQKAKVQALGYDEKFDRMWRFYLSYCEAGFRQKTIDVSQYVIG